MNRTAKIATALTAGTILLGVSVPANAYPGHKSRPLATVAMTITHADSGVTNA